MDEDEPIEVGTDVAGAPGFRVIRLGEPLRGMLRSRREATGQTVRAFLAEAVGHELPALVAALVELGLTAEAGPEGRPARLPLSSEHLTALRLAASTTGLPASLLLRVALARLSRRRRRRPAGGPVATAGSRSPKGSDKMVDRVKGRAVTRRQPAISPDIDRLPDSSAGPEFPGGSTDDIELIRR